MELSQFPGTGSTQIQAYGGGRFRIDERLYPHAILVMPNLIVEWQAPSIDKAAPASLDRLADAEPPVELLLIGCGPRMELVPRELREKLRGMGIAPEPMDTGAACRTYNVLLAEGRRVAAALLPID